MDIILTRRVYITMWQECRKYLCCLGPTLDTTLWSKDLQTATLYTPEVGEEVLKRLESWKDAKWQCPSLKAKDVTFPS